MSAENTEFEAQLQFVADAVWAFVYAIRSDIAFQRTFYLLSKYLMDYKWSFISPQGHASGSVRRKAWFVRGDETGERPDAIAVSTTSALHRSLLNVY